MKKQNTKVKKLLKGGSNLENIEQTYCIENDCQKENINDYIQNCYTKLKDSPEENAQNLLIELLEKKVTELSKKIENNKDRVEKANFDIDRMSKERNKYNNVFLISKFQSLKLKI